MHDTLGERCNCKIPQRGLGRTHSRNLMVLAILGISYGGPFQICQGPSHDSKIVGVHLSFLFLQTSNYSGQRYRGERNGEGRPLLSRLGSLGEHRKLLPVPCLETSRPLRKISLAAPSHPLLAFPPIPPHRIPAPCWLRNGQKFWAFYLKS